MNNLGQRAYARLINVSGVKSITFHGLRHTCATLALKAGVPVKVGKQNGVRNHFSILSGHPRQFLATEIIPDTIAVTHRLYVKILPRPSHPTPRYFEGL